MLKRLLQGMVVGVANIIPGVSGGTMMVAMGFYDKLIHSITHLHKEFKQSVLFLLPIFLGAGLALVTVARVLEYCFLKFPIQTNLLFCGLIVGSLPFIYSNVKGVKVKPGMIVAGLIFFAIVIGMAVMGESEGKTANLTLSFLTYLKMFGVGVIAAATMVIPGVSGSMILMILGYYNAILELINQTVDALVSFDIPELIHCCLILLPFGVGVIIGIFAIAKLIEFIFERAKAHAYWAIIGLIVASPIAILYGVDWSYFSVIALVTGAITFGLGFFIAQKLGE